MIYGNTVAPCLILPDRLPTMGRAAPTVAPAVRQAIHDGVARLNRQGVPQGVCAFVAQRADFHQGLAFAATAAAPFAARPSNSSARFATSARAAASVAASRPSAAARRM